MNRKLTFGQKVVSFLEGKGFYLVLLVCLAAVGISGWYLASSILGKNETVIPSATVSAPVDLDTSSEEEIDAVSGEAEVVISTTPAISEETTEPEPAIAPETPTEPEKDPEDIEEQSTTPTALVYTWPVKGDVLTNHSTETFVYSPTMGDWRLHTGLDIAAEQGSNVLATAAGKIVSIEHHDLMGTMVVIDHGQGIMSSYSNLQSVPTVEVGDSVYTGSIIGAVGSTAISEHDMASHLHFEMTLNGVQVHPLDYLPAR